ncbi:uncharacterized protein LOC118188620 [Stegodyphus dumicola]|uniref:uncharacterized protein LOC118188620 n=1 Tax=Stegodyphus dumicola TaxID=202533 RepID=UPI0015AEA0C1|nr:uncharacterized protein LOC118188620 [Stegodyphus dumicola]
MVTLPSSYIESLIHMYEYIQDVMIYVGKYERSDLFIAFTCNSKWPEIKKQLIYEQAPMDRHNIIARIFRQKQMSYCEVITKYHIFGCTQSNGKNKDCLTHTISYGYMTEFIPRISTKIIQELPNPQKDPELYNIVVNNMILRACGLLNPNSPCMSDGKCTPKTILGQHINRR